MKGRPGSLACEETGPETWVCRAVQESTEPGLDPRSAESETLELIFILDLWVLAWGFGSWHVAVIHRCMPNPKEHLQVWGHGLAWCLGYV